MDNDDVIREITRKLERDERHARTKAEMIALLLPEEEQKQMWRDWCEANVFAIQDRFLKRLEQIMRWQTERD